MYPFSTIFVFVCSLKILFSSILGEYLPHCLNYSNFQEPNKYTRETHDPYVELAGL